LNIGDNQVTDMFLEQAQRLSGTHGGQDGIPVSGQQHFKDFEIDLDVIDNEYFFHYILTGCSKIRPAIQFHERHIWYSFPVLHRRHAIKQTYHIEFKTLPKKTEQSQTINQVEKEVALTFGCPIFAAGFAFRRIAEIQLYSMNDL
jgi:hypothetical protein